MKTEGLRCLRWRREAGIILGLFLLLMLAPRAAVLYGIQKEPPDKVSFIEDNKSAIVQSYIQSCLGKAKKDAQCQKLRKEAIPILKEDLLLLGSSADQAYLPDLIKILQNSDEPELKAAAADAMGMIGPSQNEVPLLTKAFNDPVPLVRYSARAGLYASHDQNARLLANLASRAEEDQKASAETLSYMTHGEQAKDLDPDPLPDAKRLGAPIYAGASYLYFASDLTQGYAAFATADPVADVLKFYGAKAKRPAMTAEQFKEIYTKEPDEAEQMRLGMEMMERMMKAQKEGKSMEEVQAEMFKGMSTDVSVDKYSDKETYGTPTFLALEESSLGSVKRPTRFVVVFEACALRQTVFVLHMPATMLTAAPIK